MNTQTLYQLIPEPLLRIGIRRQCQQRLTEEAAKYADREHEQKLISSLKTSEVALSTDEANNQHYQVPSEFFTLVLGPHLKYSCCWWNDNTTSLEEAERTMLEKVCERANLQDGMKILELGCGWGSLTLYLAQRYPNMHITAMSNSTTQHAYITEQAKKRDLTNITVLTEDINVFETDEQFDAVLSIEMFEHIRNYQTLMKRIAAWLKPKGVCFVHHFCHKTYTYPFSTEENNSWMAQYFFSDGLMPSHDLLTHFDEDLIVSKTWKVNGEHYHKTCEAWLKNHKQNKKSIIQLFAHGADIKTARMQWTYWQLFFLACSELFHTHSGDEWFVQHSLLTKK